MPRDPRRVTRIHRVNAKRDDSLGRLRVSNPKQVVRLICREEGHQEAEQLEHLRAVLAEAPAHSEPIKRETAQVLCRLFPELLIGPSVYDRIHGLLLRPFEVRAEGARHPAVGEAHRLLEALPRNVVRRQLIQRDDDV